MAVNVLSSCSVYLTGGRPGLSRTPSPDSTHRAPGARHLRYCSEQTRSATRPRPHHRYGQARSSFPASATASRLGGCSGVAPPPFLEPRGPLQSSLKQHCSVAPPEPPRRAWSQKDL